jgi:hypothetical protein
VTRLLLRVWLAAGTALAWLLDALWYDDPLPCGNRDCGRRTHLLRRGPGQLLLCLSCAPAEQATRHDHF